MLIRHYLPQSSPARPAQWQYKLGQCSCVRLSPVITRVWFIHFTRVTRGLGWDNQWDYSLLFKCTLLSKCQTPCWSYFPSLIVITMISRATSSLTPWDRVRQMSIHQSTHIPRTSPTPSTMVSSPNFWMYLVCSSKVKYLLYFAWVC